MAKIKITESELKELIRESVENVLEATDYSKSWEDMTDAERNAVADSQWWKRPLRPFQTTSKQMANAQKVYTNKRNNRINSNKPIYTQSQYDQIKSQYNTTKQLYDETLKSAQGLWEKLDVKDAQSAYAKVDELNKKIGELTKANQSLNAKVKQLNQSLASRVQNNQNSIQRNPTNNNLQAPVSTVQNTQLAGRPNQAPGTAPGTQLAQK